MAIAMMRVIIMIVILMGMTVAIIVSTKIIAKTVFAKLAYWPKTVHLVLIHLLVMVIARMEWIVHNVILIKETAVYLILLQIAHVLYMRLVLLDIIH